MLASVMAANDVADPLQMLWPPGAACPHLSVSAGYRLRCWRSGEEMAHAQLMQRAGFSSWQADELARTWHRLLLPEGFFVIEQLANAALVATAMATNRPAPRHPAGCELGWVAADPQHAGKGLGKVVCAAAVQRLLDAGCRRIYLQTDDYRLPAIRTYLTLGFRPYPFTAALAARWQALCSRLALPYVPLEE